MFKGMRIVSDNRAYPTFVTGEQIVVAERCRSTGQEVYVEGPYECGFKHCLYGYLWVLGPRVQKLDGRGYDIKIPGETPPRIIEGWV